MNRAVVIIPARYGSTRLPGKPLIEIAGKPLIVHVIDRARKIENIDRILVATDNEQVAQVVRDAGCEAQLTPENLVSGSDRVGWVARNLEHEIVINLQGDEPDIDTQAVGEAVACLQKQPQIPVATLGFPLKNETDWRNPHVVKVITDEQQNAVYFSRSPIPYFRDSHFHPIPNLYRHVGVYIYRRDFLLRFLSWQSAVLEKTEKLEQLRILSRGNKIKVIQTATLSIGVDTAADVERMERHLTQKV